MSVNMVCRRSGIVGSMLTTLWLLEIVIMTQGATALTYDVGGANGWTLQTNFTSWALENTFQLNDTLVFKYREGDHDVLVVDEASYKSCTTTNAIGTMLSGRDEFTLTETEYYFICSTMSHCSLGQKMHVSVSDGVRLTSTNKSGSNSESPSTPPISDQSNSAPLTLGFHYIWLLIASSMFTFNLHFDALYTGEALHFKP